MSATAEKVVSEALSLPPALRAFVAEKLIESLDAPDAPPLSAKWKKEVLRRCAQVDRGAVKLRDAEAVFAKAYASLT
ncbi:MAG: addiction module protein [Verrucomicrobia bacterium]|nr:addiction module protein [Verrucomicrobiota bacterium]MBU1910234.1 addiction module protein [Verrucomicrobiota bacterium]